MATTRRKKSTPRKKAAPKQNGASEAEALRYEIRKAFFNQQGAGERKDVEFGGFTVEIEMPTETAFEKAHNDATSIVGDQSETNRLLLVESLIMSQTFIPGTDIRLFEEGEDIKSGPFGGHYSTLRVFVTKWIVAAREAGDPKNSESAEEDGASSASPSNGSLTPSN